MKKIRELNESTPGLAKYLNVVGDEANWEEFRSHNSGASRNELMDALAQNQHGLCAYCENVIKGWRRQIEHVIPQSDDEMGKSKALYIANLVACCVGGTESKASKRGGTSCGQAKGNQNDPNFIDPRILPALPSLMRVLDNGLIEADENACQMVGFLSDHVTRTIEILNLNAEWLRSLRENRWNGLNEEWQQIDDPDDPDEMNKWIRDLLTPNENGQLASFFTTTRSYFDPLSESILAEQPQTWI